MSEESRSLQQPSPVAADRVRVEVQNGFAVLSMNRPERGNALNASIVDALSAALGTLGERSDIHTWVLRGEGAQFCTGFDLTNLEAQSDGDLLLRFVRVEQLLQTLASAPVRTVAYAHGRAWGAGADLFTACDQRVAHASATFRFPGAQFGLVLGTRRLVQRVGPDRTRTLLLDGVSLDAGEALKAGLATHAVEFGYDDWRPMLKEPVVDRETLATILTRTRNARDDEDLGALVRSAARPGLSRRLAAYRERLAKRYA